MHQLPTLAVMAVDECVARQGLTVLHAVVVVEMEAIGTRINHLCTPRKQPMIEKLNTGVARQKSTEIVSNACVARTTDRRQGRQQEGIIGVEIGHAIGIAYDHGFCPGLNKSLDIIDID